ncbi:hypothetical protein BOTBODRAFT_407289 [Botryobasidium botryosum FD-172 SS1]|uniref:Kinesin-like protein unc-104 n=1 Tax=Botryobasidium botryosum (strain FD-172 SS1) TaxID=930990 RepID=A0A067MM60_BOTB1|nr:hypothetical protein BOTBODRAFT_407289 [Botryobasidium botryosum FD-172 SS1]
MADHGGGDGNIKVVVRCRPLNSREIARGAKGLIRMEGNQTFLDPPELTAAEAKSGRATERKTMAFSFDKSYWSAGPRDDPKYCSQQTLYDDLGKELLDHGFAGFNACILTYGQTGSGKSYSMMGYGADKGIIPLTCSELFTRLETKTSENPNVTFSVEVSYIEIYNEKVRDLLNPKNKGNLKVREHPSLGPYVEDLSKLLVNSYDDMMTLMDEGNKARTVAATNMNETSSRSHAVFTLVLTQKRRDVETNLETEKVSRISLVDLAGSERANSTGATGQRLKEGANINKSLTTLGKVIASLALASSGDGKSKAKGEFVPYRDSVLTWLLKDSLGGNSKTAMIAAISPADYEETLSTLRYADQAKKIKNKAVVNEDPNAKLIRELKEELDMLRSRVSGGSSEAVFDPSIPAAKQMVTYQTKEGITKTVSKAALQEQLESSEKLMQSLNETWEEKLIKTQEIQKEREQALEELGITIDKNLVGVHTPKKMPHLVNLNEDPLMSECLIYQLKPGSTLVGRMDSETPAAIRLSGDNIIDEHCVFENTDGRVVLYARPNSVTLLNGKQITVDHPYKLRSGFRIILGDSHVFRFNNPEEVRKQRAKSSLHISTLAADGETDASSTTRPGSPMSVTDADADWTFAQREAALARLHGLDPALESLPDEDINKLFDRITKLKTMRESGHKSRAESSMSQADDVWSESGRPVSSDTITDDTSLEAGAGTPYFDGATGGLQVQLDAQRAEFESRLSAMQSYDTEDLKVEKEHMEHQLKMVQAQMKRLIDIRTRGATAEAEGFVVFEPTLYTARELKLIRKVLDKWRAHRSFSMAETVLSNAVVLKEANVISKELGKDVSYNFTIASGGSLAAPASALGTIAGLDELGDVTDPVLASSTQPSVGVKVIDKRNNAIYVWSLDRLQQQLQRMRNLTTFVDRPSYSQHFSSSEPFYNNPAPEYSFIGNAMVSLASLSRRLSSTSVVPIFCRYTAEAIGSCRVDIRVASVVQPKSPYGSAAPSRSASPMPGSLPSGSKLSFFVTVDSIKGLSSLDFASIHAQLRVSSFVGPHVASEEVFASNPLDMDTSTLSELKFRRTFSLAITPKVAAHLRSGYAPIEFFAIVRPSYLERMERWDDLREQRTPANLNSPQPFPPPPAMRRSETDFIVEQTHDVVAWLQVCELTAEGDYLPVPVVSQSTLDPGSFFLHQGLQRRLALALSSNSGRQLPWTRVSRIRVGNVRLLDEKGRLHEPSTKSLVDLKILKQHTVEFNTDGTGSLSIEALWDSSVHDSQLLNRVTGSNQRILLQVGWTVDIDTAEPTQFSMDVAVTVQTRDARPPSKWMTFIGSSKVLSKTSTVFSLRLTPPLTRSAKDLWRLDTSEKYVRGEETLAAWKPRGVSVVEDYERLDTRERRAADVQAVKIILANNNGSPKSSIPGPERDPDALLKKALGLWQKRFGSSSKAIFSQESSDRESSDTRSIKTTITEPAEPLKLVGQTKIMPRTDTSTKTGHLMFLSDARDNVWIRRWFVLRRPHLHMYAHSNELEETGVISLAGVKVEQSEEMEVLLDRPFTFTLFTSLNSYVLAAPSAKERQNWILKLDPTKLP